MSMLTLPLQPFCLRASNISLNIGGVAKFVNTEVMYEAHRPPGVRGGRIIENILLN